MQDKINLQYDYIYAMKFELIIPVLPVRKDKSHKAELVNQILFGETIELIEENTDWSFIKTIHDGYSGWVEFRSFYFREYKTVEKHDIISSFVAEIKFESDILRIPFGSYFNSNGIEIIDGNYTDTCSCEEALLICKTQLLGAPYLWGGRTGFGIDCSGLTQIFYRLLNIDLPRDAYLQAGVGDDIFLSQAIDGDLLFFRNAEGHIVHVGIAISDHSILHASGNVRIDRYDENGIFNDTLNTYTHEFAFAKRITKL